MNFRTKITVTYSVLILFLAFILGIAYNDYHIGLYEKNEYKNLEMMTEKISQQFEENIKPMEFISEYILSDIEVLDALVTLASMNPKDKLRADYIKAAEEKIRLKLNSYYITKNFYRVLVYNSVGNIVSSEDYFDKLTDKTIGPKDLYWISEVNNQKGKPVLIGVHKDDWSVRNKKEVYSVVKEIQGMSMGYIEVQRKASELEKIFSAGRDEVDVVAIKSGGEILYSSLQLNDKSKAFYMSVAETMPGETREYENPVNHDTEVISNLYSDESKISVLLIENKKYITEALSSVAPMSLIITGCLLTVSITYIVIVSWLLTKPMKKLKLQMERTGIDTLEEKIEVDRSNDEIVALGNAYQLMLTRLNEAIIKERKRSFLQMQAQYDALQAQVNPHFLYNVLNTISYRGMKNDGEGICDMCYNLASMLRYSTSNKERQSKISDEIAHLERYFFLLKARYEHKLEYTVNIEEKIKEQVIPKIVLQQIVENSITHGFNSVDKIMKIQVAGWEDQGRWYIMVTDNGQGFPEDIAKQLELRMEETKKLLMNGERNVELEIGGMGLINTYARLLLLYGNGLAFKFYSDKNGTRVLIGAPMKEMKGFADV